MMQPTEANKKRVEALFRKALGPTAEQRAAIKAIAAEPVWRVKCRHCGTYNDAVRLNALGECSHCGNLLKEPR